MHYVLIYDTAPDYLQRRGDYRAEHLALAWQWAEAGELVLGGALGEPVERAMLLFDCDSPEVPASFARQDPYVRNGLVDHWRVLPWHTVVGEKAATPVLPE
ncbi:YciI-like protein [Gallaecimonas kandeliae]|uniref:YciI-like protein n=1 Tax=Gallaecimonas kandeliae TaxID=3029055 RepID=UPI00264724CA|nr:YciI-like protein [Gallaecimonas kandeliae]WKE64311.1 YciI-like protein [Gallaecimonas kandeliae]